MIYDDIWGMVMISSSVGFREKRDTFILIDQGMAKIDAVLTMASHPLMLLDAGDVRTNRNMRCSKGGTNYRKAEETCIIDHGEKNKMVYIIQQLTKHEDGLWWFINHHSLYIYCDWTAYSACLGLDELNLLSTCFNVTLAFTALQLDPTAPILKQGSQQAMAELIAAHDAWIPRRGSSPRSSKALCHCCAWSNTAKTVP